MAADMSGINTDPSYANSQSFSFTPTANPLPQEAQAYSDLNTKYTNDINAQQTVPQIQQQSENKYNIPFLQNTANQQNAQANMVGNQLQTLPASIASASQNSLLTQGQKDNIVASRALPLQQQQQNLQTNANATNVALGTAETNQGNYVAATQAQQLKQLMPDLQAYDEMNIQNAAAQTAWNAQNAWELSNLINNAANGVNLSEGQQGRMEALASQENAFQNSLTMLQKQSQNYLNLWGQTNGS